MAGILDVIRTCARLAWWDGSSIDLRLHRLGDLAFGREPERVPVRVRAIGERA
ncbi:hypothetical protein [Methylobacterium sp. sgz302541]|uniref:hypothetical protein n=1 Tax=unclassified Methylobacterium TaxID=2615210 RepID=UPI003D355CC2